MISCTSVKFESIHNAYHSSIYTWKYRPQNGGQICPASFREERLWNALQGFHTSAMVSQITEQVNCLFRMKTIESQNSVLSDSYGWCIPVNKRSIIWKISHYIIMWTRLSGLLIFQSWQLLIVSMIHVMKHLRMPLAHAANLVADSGKTI